MTTSSLEPFQFSTESFALRLQFMDWYLFNQICINTDQALDVQASMKDASWYNRVVDMAVTFVSILYVTFGSISYMFFKDDTDSEITLNLGDK